MIRYKASDIVKRAKQLADIENSDYISWNEEIALLNESYVGLYQKLVDLNDNCIVMSFETSEKFIPLPPNFWQLKSVSQIGYRGNLYPIMKRAPNQPETVLSYDLRNDVIKINGECTNIVRIEYYANPKTITFPNKTLELEYPVVDMYRDLALSITGLPEDRHYVVTSINDPSINFDLPISSATYTEIGMNSDWVIFEDTTAFDRTYLAYRFIDGQQFELVDKIPTVYKDKFFYYYDKGLYFIDSDTKALDVEEINVTRIKQIIIDGPNIVKLADNNKVILNDELLELKKPIFKLIVRDREITGISDSDYYVTIKFGRVNENMSEYAIYSAIDNNDNTGYGYLGKRFNKYYIISNLEDTVLNFPNSFYFTMLAYKLALAFKSKQGADTSQLLQLYTDAENTFSNTLTSDDWSVTRITNVY